MGFPLLVWKKGYKREYGIAGFRKTGIIPFNPNAISPRSSLPYDINKTGEGNETPEHPIPPSNSSLTSSISLVQSTPPCTSVNPTTNEKSTPSSTPSSGSSITTLRDVLSDILKPATPQRSKGGKRKQLVGIGQSLTSDEALKILQEVEKEKEMNTSRG